MISAIRHNLGLELVSLIVAIVLWGFVTIAENPPETREVQVQVLLVNIPDGLMLLRKSPDTARITVRGLRRIVREIKPGEIQLLGDLSGLSAGEHKVSLVAEPSRVGVDVVNMSIREAQVTLDKLTEVVLPVVVKTKGRPAEGYVISSPQVRPAEAKVRGPDSLLADVHHIVAHVDVSGTSSSMEVNAQLRAVNERGEARGGIRVDPVEGTVTIPVTKAPSRTVRIEPRVGSPPEGFYVAAVRVEPPEVTVSGEAAVLERLARVPTKRINISDLRGTRTYTTEVDLPTGIRPVTSGTITVTVTVAPGRTRTNTGEPSAETVTETPANEEDDSATETEGPTVTPAPPGPRTAPRGSETPSAPPSTPARRVPPQSP